MKTQTVLIHIFCCASHKWWKTNVNKLYILKTGKHFKLLKDQKMSMLLWLMNCLESLCTFPSTLVTHSFILSYSNNCIIHQFYWEGKKIISLILYHLWLIFIFFGQVRKVSLSFTIRYWKCHVKFYNYHKIWSNFLKVFSYLNCKISGQEQFSYVSPSLKYILIDHGH